MAQATTQVNGGRLQALGAATTALSAYNTAQQVGNLMSNPSSAASISIDVSLGNSNSQSTQSSSVTTNAASTVTAGGDVKFTATGAGADSNINIVGSNIKAGKDIHLTADNQVNIVAATNTGTNSNSTSGSSASIGVGFSMGATTGFTLNASASQNQGKGKGKDTSFSNSTVTAANTVTIKSGGDTNLIGGIVNGNKVVTDIGGDLTIASPQATSTYTESSTSSGFGAKLCIPPFCVGTSSFSASYGENNIDSNFKSTGDASGIHAGDGGFQVKVGGKTTLTGGQITSTQVAVDKNLNTYSAAGGTTTTDLQNSANYNAEGISLSATVSTKVGDQGNAATQQNLKDMGFSPDTINNAVKANNKTPANKPVSSIGIGQASGEASSTTVSGITGFAGNQDVRTGDASTGLTTIFDKDTVKNDVNAQVTLTATFGQMAPKAVGDYAEKMWKEADKNNDEAGKELWKEGGSARIALHVAVGGLGGGNSGAVGAGVSQTAVPLIAEQINATDLPEPLKQTLTAIAGATVGLVVAGPAGGAAGFNATVNNYLSHPEREKLNKATKDCMTTGNAQSCKTVTTLKLKDELSDKLLANAVVTCTGSECNDVTNFIYKEMAALGCTPPAACPDATNLQKYWGVAKEKAQGLQPVYPEAWIMDGFALYGLGKFGVRMLAGTGGKGSLDALGQLGKTDATLAEANFTNLPTGVNGLAPVSVNGGVIAPGKLIGANGGGLIPPGKLIGSVDGLTTAEQSFIGEMVSGGKTVQVIPSTNAGRTADFFIDGTKYELKTMTSVVNQTSDGLSSAISTTAMNARAQSGNIIIDARGQAGMTSEIAQRGINRAFSADSRTGAKIESITIITPEGTVYVPRTPGAKP